MGIADIIRGFIADDNAPQRSTTDLVSELKGRYGSGRAASRATGIPESTLRRWAKGATPSARSAARVESAQRHASLKLVDPKSFRLEVTDRQDGRLRKLTAEQLELKPGTFDRVRDAYLKGDHDGAVKEFVAGVGNDWYRNWLTPGSDLAQTGTMDGRGGGPAAAAARATGTGETTGGSESSSGGGVGAGGGDYDGGDDWGDGWTVEDLAAWDGADYGGVITGGSN